MSEFLVKQNTKDTTEIYALAQERKTEGNKDFVNYVLSRSSKKLDELLQMEEATEVLDRAKTSRMEILL